MIELRDINKTYFNGAPLHVLKGINLVRQPNEGKIYRKVGLADCGNDFSDTL